MDTHTLTQRDRAPRGTAPSRWALALVVGIAGSAATGYAGWWWVQLLIGVVIALLVRWSSPAIPIALVAGATGYALALYVGTEGAAVAQIARVAASLAGFGNDAGLVVLLTTVVYGGLLCLGGAWVAVAGAPLAPGRTRANRPGRSPAVPAAAPTRTAPAAERIPSGARNRTEADPDPEPDRIPTLAGAIARGQFTKERNDD